MAGETHFCGSYWRLQVSARPFSSGWLQLILPTRVSSLAILCGISSPYVHGLELSHRLYLKKPESGLPLGLQSTLPSGALPHDIWSPLPLQPVPVPTLSTLSRALQGGGPRKKAGLPSGFPFPRGHMPVLPLSDVCKGFFILLNFWEQKPRHIL